MTSHGRPALTVSQDTYLVWSRQTKHSLCVLLQNLLTSAAVRGAPLSRWGPQKTVTSELCEILRACRNPPRPRPHHFGAAMSRVCSGPRSASSSAYTSRVVLRVHTARKTVCRALRKGSPAAVRSREALQRGSAPLLRGKARGRQGAEDDSRGLSGSARSPPCHHPLTQVSVVSGRERSDLESALLISRFRVSVATHDLWNTIGRRMDLFVPHSPFFITPTQNSSTP